MEKQWMPQLEQKKPQLLIFDEAQSFLYGNDRLDETLRELPGVPGHDYAVVDGRVFVFEALRKLVQREQREYPEKPLEDIVRQVLPQAWVSAAEAVGLWGVLPRHFAVESKDGIDLIVFTPFDAAVPDGFRSQQELRDALATLLLGGTIAGDGDFTYRGQALISRQAVRAIDLPPVPRRLPEYGDGRVVMPVLSLSARNYTVGHPLLTEEGFAELCQREQKWRAVNEAVKEYVESREGELWCRMRELDYAALHETGELDEEMHVELGQLREAYPEFAAMGDYTLYSNYDSYMTDCMGYHRWYKRDIWRDADAMHFTLGRLVDGGKVTRYDDREAGRYLGYLLLQDVPFDQAQQEALIWREYHDVLRKMVWRAREITVFLDGGGEPVPAFGRPVTTMTDLYRRARKYCGPLAVVQQDLADLQETLGEKWGGSLAANTQEDN